MSDEVKDTEEVLVEEEVVEETTENEEIVENPVDEEIEEDEVIYEEEDEDGAPNESAAGEGGGFFEEKKNIILSVVAVIVLAILGGVWWQQGLAKKEIEAQDLMIPAVSYYERDSTRLAIYGDGQNSGFEAIMEDFSGTPAANLAKMYLGLCYMKQNQFDVAIDYLEGYSKGNDMVASSAYAALGYAYEENGEFDRAAKNYESAARTPQENKFTTPYFLMDAGRCYESSGDNSKALDVYREIKKKFPISEEGQDIDRYIGRLSNDES